MAEPGIPPGINVFGPDGNCTLAICPVEYSIYGYRPSLAASVALIVFYAIAALIHLYLGLRWKRWAFTSCMLVGSVVAILGYVGRIIMWHNPFNFSGFMLQISKSCFPLSRPTTIPLGKGNKKKVCVHSTWLIARQSASLAAQSSSQPPSMSPSPKRTSKLTSDPHSTPSPRTSS